ncbi:MAG: HDOD domain-containing protein [Planctomycetota bacterium]
MTQDSGTQTTDLCALLARQIAERRLELPVLPAVATEVLSLCQQEATDAARLSAVIHRDQSLAANVLRVANSAAYVGQVPCGSLQQAVSRLGMQLITEIAVAVAVKGRVFAGSGCAELFRHLWRHAVMTGFFTKEIARQRRRNVEVAFLCGLLHDVGKAVLLANVARHVDSGDVQLADLADGLQQHHAEVGAALAEGWKMPEQIVESIRCHHDYDRATKFSEAAMTVALADLIAHFVEPTEDQAPLHADALRQHPVLLGLNLYPDQLQQLLQLGDKAIALAEGMA